MSSRSRILDIEDRKFDERAVNVLTTGLLDTLRRNERLVPFLTEVEE